MYRRRAKRRESYHSPARCHKRQTNAPLGYTGPDDAVAGERVIVSSITGDMLIKDVLSSYPRSAEVFGRHGLGCPSCLAAGMETLSQVATMHDVDERVLLSELNACAAAPAAEEE